MNSNLLPIEELIESLNFAGREPDPDLINAIWHQRESAESLLLELFYKSLDDAWPLNEDPRWYRFIHAGKFMIAWQNEEALPTFVRLF